ncbi:MULTISPECIES: PDR/VanB family oxidoreductase [Nocardiaceae]|uniref:PDR/VanB family oxidoreductase n=1 Tax=Nocardiaceae TaxID=85025 RepID=UPI000561F1BC|nr:MULTISPECIES: PDR/VanB family oxidoreductase [Rhodococcus]OZF03650.1 oxidoreductase [Rhodococcus sp. 15-1189-1-1a]OZF17455.1 oxidoreductase [Rhodococcus sp. 14-2686-1-2]OZF53673.1 oxidoreductase [Rhodococcus sp. 14-2470-1b]
MRTVTAVSNPDSRVEHVGSKKKTGLRKRLSDMARTVDTFREGRQVPQDLYGRDVPDQTMSLVTDALDKWFALLDNGEFDDSHAAAPVVRDIALTLRSREVLCGDQQVVRLEFESPSGEELPAWAPGMHLDFVLPSGRRRQYSLCGDPSDAHAYTVAVRFIPDGGGGSAEMHALEIGTPVTVTGPRNGFPFVADGRAVFVAGGIGITAILPMVRAARATGMDWYLEYRGRSRESLPFLDEILALDDDRVNVRTDDVDGIASGSELLDRVAGGAVYCCGPPPMIDAVRAAVDGTDATHLYFERFSPPPVRNGVEFEVQLVDSGDVITVGAEQTALQAIREVRPSVAYSCQQGFCGTCRTRVLVGTPEHRETRLTPEEQESEMLICVSRAAGGRIVLDL